MFAINNAWDYMGPVGSSDPQTTTNLLKQIGVPFVASNRAPVQCSKQLDAQRYRNESMLQRTWSR